MRLRPFLATFAAAAAYIFSAAFAHAERRVALVLGNGDYKHAVKLPNAPNDAEAMAGMLKSLGFDVVFGQDLGRDEMTVKMADFGRLTVGADAALFFYAGHGMQIDGKNLLIPVDADLKSELDAKMRTIEIDSVLQHTMADAKVKFVLLDACRDNPFANQIRANAPKTRSVTISTGLAEMRPGEGTLIAFATGPGQVALDGEGKHSPFTRALLAHLPTQGVEIQQALTGMRAQVADDTRRQQLPWQNTNMTGYFYMSGKHDAVAAPAVTAAAPQTGVFDPRVMELELWNSVKASSSADDYKAYVERYPNGTFADLARTRMAALNRPATPSTSAVTSGPSTEVRTAEASKATEDALGLDTDAWRELQRRLTHLGFATRGMDGRVGEGTRKSVAAWQSARGYPATSYLNKLQREALMVENVPAVAPATRSASSNDEEEKPRKNTSNANRPSNGNSNGNSSGAVPGAGAAGEFLGGVVRGATGLGKKFPW